mmetsp:Transcript_21603/g.43818  ORF Transcript_21603/g.43818 Transcript_21603/m.43818 type:complete len:204 (+) Transcript_21603:689-1300(+)
MRWARTAPMLAQAVATSAGATATCTAACRTTRPAPATTPPSPIARRRASPWPTMAHLMRRAATPSSAASTTSRSQASATPTFTALTPTKTAPKCAPTQGTATSIAPTPSTRATTSAGTWTIARRGVRSTPMPISLGCSMTRPALTPWGAASATSGSPSLAATRLLRTRTARMRARVVAACVGPRALSTASRCRSFALTKRSRT